MSEQEQDVHEYFVTLIGADRMVNSFVNQGSVVERGQTVQVGRLQQMRLLQMEYDNPRTGEPAPYWREATTEEIETLRESGRFDSDTGEYGSKAALDAAAREEALSMGAAHPDTEEAISRRKAIERNRDPVPTTRRRRTRRSATREE